MREFEFEDKEHSLRTSQFEWTVTFATVQRLERQLRELRVTSLVLMLATFVISLAVLSMERQLSGTVQITLTISALWWAMTYAYSFMLHVGPSFMRPFEYTEELERKGLSATEVAEHVEHGRYFARRLARITRMVTMLMVMGVGIVAMSIVYTLMVSMR